MITMDSVSSPATPPFVERIFSLFLHALCLVPVKSSGSSGKEGGVKNRDTLAVEW